MALLIELLVMAAMGALGWLGGRSGVEHVLAKGAAISATEVRTVAEIHGHAQRAGLFFAAGIAALILGRLVSARRGQLNISSPLVMPATCAALAIGFALQMGYGDPLHRTLWPQLQGLPALSRLYLECEQPLVPVLFAMEHRGVLVDPGFKAQHIDAVTLRVSCQVAEHQFPEASTAELRPHVHVPHLASFLRQFMKRSAAGSLCRMGCEEHAALWGRIRAW